MPTEQEQDDLCNKCDWTWTTLNGVNGYVVRGSGDYSNNSIFLPCGGDGYWDSRYDVDQGGYYWSSIPHSDTTGADSIRAYALYFGLRNHHMEGSCREYGFSVRPVQ